MSEQRSTGWKIPLVFCAVILTMSALSVFLRQTGSEAAIAALPEELVDKAEAIVINLEADAVGKEWKNKIYHASGGFSSRQARDAKIAETAISAIRQRAFGAACVAITAVSDAGAQDYLLKEMADAASTNCEDLPWAVFAAKGFNNNAQRAELHKDLVQRWDNCKK